MKLSKAQQAVVDLMREGWSLCSSTSISISGIWLQEYGCGCGGQTQKVNAHTFFALKKRGVIEIQSNQFPTSCHRLTKEWRAAE